MTNITGKRVCVSGAGNVAEYCARKLVAEGATVLTMSDTSGYAMDETCLFVKLLKCVCWHYGRTEYCTHCELNVLHVFRVGFFVRCFQVHSL